MILPILQDGDPLLRKRARRVTEFGTPYLQDLVANMWQTMNAVGGLGLAAPQVGHCICLFIFGGVEEVPQTVLINPKVEPIGEQLIPMEEGCLSIEGVRAQITRPAAVHYSGYDVWHRFIEGQATGLHARVILHEYDHLKGILLTDRIEDEKSINQAV